IQPTRAGRHGKAFALQQSCTRQPLTRMSPTSYVGRKAQSQRREESTVQEAQPVRQQEAPGPRARRALVAGLAIAVTTIAVVAIGAAANAATLFSDDFNDGNANGWSASGGSWSAASGAYTQSGTSASAKSLAGSTAWSTTTV